MRRARYAPRKLLFASAGAASLNYVLASGCIVANLVTNPRESTDSDGSRDAGSSEVPDLAAAPPDAGSPDAGSSDAGS